MKSVLSFAACLTLVSALSPAPTFVTSVAAAAPDCTFRPTQTITATEGCPTTCATVQQCYADGEYLDQLPAMLLLVTCSCWLTSETPLSSCGRARVRMHQDGRRPDDDDGVPYDDGVRAVYDWMGHRGGDADDVPAAEGDVRRKLGSRTDHVCTCATQMQHV